MFEFLLFIFGVFLIAYFWPKPKQKPLDISKNSEYFMKEYPDICKPDLTDEPEKPQVVINVYNTHNHLHVYPSPGESTPEGNQPH